MVFFKNIRKSKKISILFLIYIIFNIFIFFWPSISFNSIKNSISNLELDPQVWALYIGLYGNPYTNDNWIYWKLKKDRYSQEYYIPPGNLGITHYPSLGLYSSHDKSVLRAHFSQLSESGIDAIILQWWGQDLSEENVENSNGYTDITLNLLLEVANEFKIKIGISIQPYPGRNFESIFNDIKYIIDKHCRNPSYLKINQQPVFLIYDPHIIDKIYLSFEKLKDLNYNPFLIASIVDYSNYLKAFEDGFNGIYSYFASIDSTYSSNLSNWNFLQQNTEKRNLIFIPTVSPGYNDQKSNRWGGGTKKNRDNGLYYDQMWESAINSGSKIVLINSFNNLYDGTAIESCIQRNEFQLNEENWVSDSLDFNAYLKKTKKWIEKMKE